MWQANQVLDPSFFERAFDDRWVKSLHDAISPLYHADENEILSTLIPFARPTAPEIAQISETATSLIEAARRQANPLRAVDALMQEFSLDSYEGVQLMCLAEALTRIPDRRTADALIKDKLALANWAEHLQRSGSMVVNASTWGLILSKRMLTPESCSAGKTPSLHSVIGRLSQPAIRRAMKRAMRLLGHRFVLGETLTEALHVRSNQSHQTYSFDMLGEAAVTQHDAERYFDAYYQAITEVGRANRGNNGSASVSVKLSALHPRYEVLASERAHRELFERLNKLVSWAVAQDVPITIDAEEMDRLELGLSMFEKVYESEVVRGWGRFGLVIQAYSKRSLATLVWLNALAKHRGDTIPVRLVKGAYWDSEIKWAQQAGLKNYPVFAQKSATDVAYLACARFLLSSAVGDALLPQFATHNAHSVAAILAMAQGRAKHFEFQRLHGMGEGLYKNATQFGMPLVRVYAPIGSHSELLPYLVRRLLENGANNSFVHKLVDESVPISELIVHPVDALKQSRSLHSLPLPTELFKDRANSRGINLNVESERLPFIKEVGRFSNKQWLAYPLIALDHASESMIKEKDPKHTVYAPFNYQRKVGQWQPSDLDHVSGIMSAAVDHIEKWQTTDSEVRAACIARLADELEANRAEFVALCQLEAGKTFKDAIDEVREAVDFCRYYAQRASTHKPRIIKTVADEEIAVIERGLGTVVCISPWNFPLAIFVGQVAAALVAGNCVVAKPAEQTNLIAFRCVELMIECGIPLGVIQLVLGSGSTIGNALVSHPLVAGVAFTGSTETSRRINRALAESISREQPDTESASQAYAKSLIAETGGLNAMVVDSSALPEQVVSDVMRSAFASAGQRCSALRVLFVQQEIASQIETLLKGALKELCVGDPLYIQTDVGPVIDATAKRDIHTHIERFRAMGRLIAQAQLPQSCRQGHFIAPTVLRLGSMSELTQEVFGPVLHLITFSSRELDKVAQSINASGFGLTLGVHSRNETTYRWLEKHIAVGNCYINRDQVGAVVGVQPFGGQGLSGTGPKAGGPRYVDRFVRLRAADNTCVEERLGHPTSLDEENDGLQCKQVTSTGLTVREASATQRRWKQLSFATRLQALMQAVRSLYIISDSAIDRLSAALASSIGVIEQLDGPTGESNELYTTGKGMAAIIDFSTIEQQDSMTEATASVVLHTATALAAGNGVLVVSDDAKVMKCIKSLRQSLVKANLDGALDVDALMQVVEISQWRDLLQKGSLAIVTLVAANRQQTAQALATLSQIKGPITSVIEDDATLRSVLLNDPNLGYRYTTERTRTINTAALGGNPALLGSAQGGNT